MSNKISPLSYEARIDFCQNPLGKKLLRLMVDKNTNLSIAADVTKKKELLNLADQTGPYIAILKTHIDILEDYDEEVIPALIALAKKHQFFLFEDRKFADIGNTVQAQYKGGVYQIASWAHLTNAHPLPGPGIIEGLKSVGLSLGNGLLLLAEMSSKGSLATGEYTQKTVAMAKDHKDFVVGFIARKKMDDHPGFITMTPGIKLSKGSDHLDQQYLHPHEVIAANHSDLIIVGRDIIQDPQPAKKARIYQEVGWKAYTHRG